MGIIDYYSTLYGDRLVKDPVTLKELPEEPKGFPLLEDAKDITLAQYDRNTKEILTAHNMRDYRRKIFNLELLPSITTYFDLMLEGSDYWYEKLHNESPYT